ncbi:MAG: hypothetical protein ABH854_03125, partial [Candidatus Diapherotrites archaeon]
MNSALEMHSLSKLFNCRQALLLKGMCLGAKKTIHFWDLPETTRFVLNRNFCIELFDKASEGSLQLLA